MSFGVVGAEHAEGVDDIGAAGDGMGVGALEVVGRNVKAIVMTPGSTRLGEALTVLANRPSTVLSPIAGSNEARRESPLHRSLRGSAASSWARSGFDIAS
jgi:hypothetical protein